MPKLILVACCLQVCCVCKTRRPVRGPSAHFLHDRRQRGQDFGAPGALQRDGQEPRRGGARGQDPVDRVQRQPGAGDQVRGAAAARLPRLQGEQTAVHGEGQGPARGHRRTGAVHARAQSAQGRTPADAHLRAQHRPARDHHPRCAARG